MYNVIRNSTYDFAGQSYADMYPGMHKYPATMLPQIGVEILKELNITDGKLLDPYCGSGSTFTSGLECGLTDMYGFDLNPLAVLISNVKFTNLRIQDLEYVHTAIRNDFQFALRNDVQYILKPYHIDMPQITNIDFWFPQKVINQLSILKHFIDTKILDENIRRFFLLPFSETVRECSYTRNNEFKLYRMKQTELSSFDPNPLWTYFKKLSANIQIFKRHYAPKLSTDVRVNIQQSEFPQRDEFYDVVLTSPPYGDSKTTVAYGQFSALSNEWLGITDARKLDNALMGGKRKGANQNTPTGLIADYIKQIEETDKKRAGEVSMFYNDLNDSIKKVSRSVKTGGKVIYVVGNRTVKNIQLPTDQFIAEKFEENGFGHLMTYERALSGKRMPSANSPTNKTGQHGNTMLFEYVIVCVKRKDG